MSENLKMSLYSWDVEEIREKKEFQNLCEDWDREGTVETAPPCIDLTIKSENVDKLKEWLNSTDYEYRLL